MRDEIRALLVGCVPPSDLEWMVSSCPSVDDARDEVRRRQGDPNWNGVVRREAKLQLSRADRIDIEKLEKVGGR